MSVDERLRPALLNPYPQDRVIGRGDLDCDETYRFRLMANGYALYSLLSAQQVREEFAASYREFDVGVSALAFDATGNRFGVFHGANVKLDSTDLLNEHAEDIAIGKAAIHGFQEVVALTVVGETQEDHTSGLTTSTLHPCGRCRNRFGQEAGLITPQTTFFSATPDLATVEMYDFEALNGLHDNGDPDGIQTFRLQADAADWDEVVLPRLLARVQDIEKQLAF